MLSGMVRRHTLARGKAPLVWASLLEIMGGFFLALRRQCVLGLTTDPFDLWT